jgi:hypothetical protein
MERNVTLNWADTLMQKITDNNIKKFRILDMIV